MEKTEELLRLCKRLDESVVEYSSYKHVEHSPYNELSVAIARTILCMQLQYYLPYVVNIWQAADLFNASDEDLLKMAARIISKYECGLWNSHPILPMGLNFITRGESQPKSSFQLHKVIRADAGEVITLEWTVRQLQTKITRTRTCSEDAGKLLRDVFYIKPAVENTSGSCRIGCLKLELQLADTVIKPIAVGAPQRCSTELVRSDSDEKSTVSMTILKDLGHASTTEMVSISDKLDISAISMATTGCPISKKLSRNESDILDNTELNISAQRMVEVSDELPSTKTVQPSRTMKFVSRQSFKECINIATSDIPSVGSDSDKWGISSPETLDLQKTKTKARCYTIIEQPLQENNGDLEMHNKRYSITVTEQLITSEGSCDMVQPMRSILENPNSSGLQEENTHSMVPSQSQENVNHTCYDGEVLANTTTNTTITATNTTINTTMNTSTGVISDHLVLPPVEAIIGQDIKPCTTLPETESELVNKDSISQPKFESIFKPITGGDFKPCPSEPAPCDQSELHSVPQGLFDPERRITVRYQNNSQCWCCGASDWTLNSGLPDWDCFPQSSRPPRSLENLKYDFSGQSDFELFLGKQDMDYRLPHLQPGIHIYEPGDVSRMAEVTNIPTGYSFSRIDASPASPLIKIMHRGTPSNCSNHKPSQQNSRSDMDCTSDDDLGRYFLGAGSSNLDIGRSFLGAEPPNLDISRSCLGAGPSNLDIGRSFPGAGPSNLDIGRSFLDAGPSNLDIGRSFLGAGPSRSFLSAEPSTLDIGRSFLGAGPSRSFLSAEPSNLDIGRSNLDAGPSNLDIGRSFLGAEPSNLDITRSCLSAGPSNLDIGRSFPGAGPSNLDIGRSFLGAGPSNLDISRSFLGAGPSTLDIGMSILGAGPSNLNIRSNLGVGPSNPDNGWSFLRAEPSNLDIVNSNLGKHQTAPRLDSTDKIMAIKTRRKRTRWSTSSKSAQPQSEDKVLTYSSGFHSMGGRCE